MENWHIEIGGNVWRPGLTHAAAKEYCTWYGQYWGVWVVKWESEEERNLNTRIGKSDDHGWNCGIKSKDNQGGSKD